VTVPTVDLHSTDDPELEQIAFWRLEVLEDAGYEGAVAAELAARLDVDLHQAVRLVDRGCPPPLAARILL
jgi:hypothetical protein